MRKVQYRLIAKHEHEWSPDVAYFLKEWRDHNEHVPNGRGRTVEQLAKCFTADFDVREVYLVPVDVLQLIKAGMSEEEIQSWFAAQISKKLSI